MSDTPEKPAKTTKAHAPPFAIVAVRSIARQVLNSSKPSKGITMKAGHLLSYAAGKVLEQIVKEATEQAKKTEANTLTKAHIIDVCLRTPKFRFIVSLLKANEAQQYFGPSTELSKRVNNSLLNKQFSLAVPFVAPTPPSRSGNTEEEVLCREHDTANQIFSVLSMSVSAYMNQVPSFFKIDKK